MSAAGYAFAGLSLVGSGVSAWGQVESGRTNRALADFNARQLDAEARDTIDQGEAAAHDAQAEGRVANGAQRASIAGQGVRLDSGTALAIAADTDRKLAESVDRIRLDAVREAAGLRVQSISTRLQGRWGQRGSNLNAGGILLGGIGQAGQQAYQTYRSG